MNKGRIETIFDDEAEKTRNNKEIEDIIQELYTYYKTYKIYKPDPWWLKMFYSSVYILVLIGCFWFFIVLFLLLYCIYCFK